MVRLLWLALVALPLAARAGELDPDTEIAQRLFAEGAAAYDARDYPRALARFEEAHRIKPAPAFQFNIARCHDRLAHAAEAIAAYRRYLAQAPDAPDAAEVRARVTVLEARVAPTTGSEQRPRRSLAAPIVVGVLAVALIGTGAGLVGSIDPAYRDLLADWRSQGSTQGILNRADALRAREIAGWAVLGAGAAAAVVDVVLWVLARRSGARPVARLAGGGVAF
jgi:tetratricopeptide (TPR) repeat protein